MSILVCSHLPAFLTTGSRLSLWSPRVVRTNGSPDFQLSPTPLFCVYEASPSMWQREGATLCPSLDVALRFILFILISFRRRSEERLNPGLFVKLLPCLKKASRRLLMKLRLKLIRKVSHQIHFIFSPFFFYIFINYSHLIIFLFRGT